MTNSERIAQALADVMDPARLPTQIRWALGVSFKCYDCGRWLPMAEAARDIRQDAEEIAGVQCIACERDLWLLAEQWPGKEVA